jgi:uncharacterized protein YcbK (DUF882 family)
MDRRPAGIGRRQLLRRGIGLGALGVLSLALGPARARAAAAEPRRLRLQSTHTAERLDVVFHDGEAFVPGALAALDRFLRDPYTGDVHEIDPAVLDLAWSVARAAERPQGRFDVVCGYRSPATNARLHAHSPHGVATNSLHLQGKAIDLRLEGLPTARLRDVALRLRRGGVGFYPDDDFVHIDTGRPRSW